MNEQKEALEELFDKVENYSKTSFTLYKLQLIDKSSSLLSIVLVYIAIIVFMLFFISFINIALALFIGQWIGDYYLGFLIVSVFYLIVGGLIYWNKNKLSAYFSESVLLKLLLPKNWNYEKED
ncbi:phage holin family protein [Flavobacterium sp. U410]